PASSWTVSTRTPFEAVAAKPEDVPARVQAATMPAASPAPRTRFHQGLRCRIALPIRITPRHEMEVDQGRAQWWHVLRKFPRLASAEILRQHRRRFPSPVKYQ